MKLKLWVASGTLLAATIGAHASQPSRAPDPSDPAAVVPATVYESALTGYAPAPKDAPTPDKAWRAANTTVAGQPGHAGHHAPAPEPRKEPAPSDTNKAVPAPKPQEEHQHH
jgi:hypothetical protein